jgi:hypothetical protein
LIEEKNNFVGKDFQVFFKKINFWRVVLRFLEWDLEIYGDERDYIMHSLKQFRFYEII